MKWVDEISARAPRGLGFCGIENNFWKERGGNAEGAKRIRITAPQILASNSKEDRRRKGAKILISLSSFFVSG